MSTVFHHNFDTVEEYLHHRDPYLLIDSVVEITDRSIASHKLVTGDEHFLKGHFPGAPVVPGAMLQEMTTQTAGILIAARYNPMQDFNTEDPFHNEFALGVLVRVLHARFRGFARPGDELTVSVEMTEHVDQLFEFRARVDTNNTTIMSNSFQLANIPSATLQGVPE